MLSLIILLIETDKIILFLIIIYVYLIKKYTMELINNKDYKLKSGEVITYKGVFLKSRVSSLTLHEFYRSNGAPYSITLNKFLSWI